MTASALNQLSTVVSENKKKMVGCLVAGLITGMAFASSAAYIVKDPENIAETVKVFTETSKVVTNTLEQLGVSKVDLANINEFLDKFNKATQEHAKSINEIMAENGGYLGTPPFVNETIKGNESTDTDTDENGNKKPAVYSSADKFLATFFPMISTDSNGKMSLNAKNLAKLAYQGAVMSNNTKVLEAYKKVQEELDKAHKELAELLEENAKLGLENKKGTLAAQQLNNQIKAVQARIESLQTTMSAIKGQNEIMHSQAKVQEEQNEIVYQQAQCQANDDYIEERKAELESNEKFKAPGFFSCF